MHVPPDYYGYLGGYDSVTICEDCLTISLYEDAHPVRPCYFCGGTVKESGKEGKYSAKWISAKPRWKFWGPDYGHWQRP